MMKKKQQDQADIVSMLTQLKEQVTALERKVDTLIQRSQQKPVDTKPFSKPFQQPIANTFAQTVQRQENRPQPHGNSRHDIRFESPQRQENRFQNSNQQPRSALRPMYKTICADCKNDCEVPFRPVEGRPIYCQSCFSRRKAASSYKQSFDNRPSVLPSAHVGGTQATTIDTLQAVEKKRAASRKKPEPKKPHSKKKKSK